MSRLRPPRHISTLPLVVFVVLSLAPVGCAHAFTVQIVLPSTDPVLIATDRSQAFQAVAYDDQQQDITSEVTWSWDFGDGSAADPDNPTEHVFETAGAYTVTVTAPGAPNRTTWTIPHTTPAGTRGYGQGMTGL